MSAEKPYKNWFSEQWEGRRANIYLVVATALLLVSLGISIWGTPADSVSAATHRKAPPKPELTFFESMLVKFGLAEPPTTAPVYLGNPDTQVWVDLHTAIYYCPDAGPYGKTALGNTPLSGTRSKTS